MPVLRVPYTDPLPLPRIIPPSAKSTDGAIAALLEFLAPSLPRPSVPQSSISSKLATCAKGAEHHGKTLLLTGAGISVASGLADYRGANGTYTLNKTYRPIYFNEFCENHEARKRYWARSFLGWTTLDRARPNKAHRACGELGRLGVVGHVITQNVDSFHPAAHSHLPTTELHGYLRSLVCLTCRNEYPRRSFQEHLARLNPTWAAFLEEMLASGALDTENPDERRKKGLKANPDGDVHVPDAPYTTFRYPACPVCLATPPPKPGGGVLKMHADADGAWDTSSEGGVLKPAVIMFGESIPAATKVAAEEAVDDARRILVVGSSLATYSAWRLVKRAKERQMPIGILNMGGARGEESFFADVQEGNTGREALRISENAEQVLPEIVRLLRERKRS
ncbi:DHS-like NAD/FAD-binding domain-containing protein [Ampelomyces quisqualis]|uniref:DHS-like NAD/FAD-binding domain-containing protein n=1 Tax=Ampelomyces quisqualis TaxID=50730 RepID=A0A6A5QIF9_AMPQU|nr:DHS-like NAD/FAD-binding domain-containing protein [Ampelomyces quisqualis]